MIVQYSWSFSVQTWRKHNFCGKITAFLWIVTMMPLTSYSSELAVVRILGQVQSAERQGERWSAHLLLLNATGFLDILWVFKDGLDKLTKQALHVALAAGKQPLQEGDVSTMRRQQQGHIRQVLDYGQREGCAGRKYIGKGVRFIESSQA